MASENMMDFARKLFPICRSITGTGVRESLGIIGQIIPLKIVEVPSGTKVLDWVVPAEWNIKDAYILDSLGNKIVDFKDNNLHLMGYSEPIDKTVDLSELESHLYSLDDQPDAVPYVTSYYDLDWGFSITHSQRKSLKSGDYKVFIDSNFDPNGSLTYAELIIPGESKDEIFFSTYICHPSLANNELSGPIVTSFLAKWLMEKKRKYTYRIIFIPETIGSVTYLDKNIDSMKENIIAGFNMTCMGDEGCFSYLPTRYGNTLSDKVALNILNQDHHGFKSYSYLVRGSDEAQYNSPGVDLPIATVMKSKYGTYPEYHTSLDNLDFISEKGLNESLEFYKKCIEVLESNKYYKLKTLGVPQLGKRGLYPSKNIKGCPNYTKQLLNTIAYMDGTNDLVDISNLIGAPIETVMDFANKLLDKDLVEILDEKLSS